MVTETETTLSPSVAQSKKRYVKTKVENMLIQKDLPYTTTYTTGVEYLSENPKMYEKFLSF